MRILRAVRLCILVTRSCEHEDGGGGIGIVGGAAPVAKHRAAPVPVVGWVFVCATTRPP